MRRNLKIKICCEDVENADEIFKCYVSFREVFPRLLSFPKQNIIHISRKDLKLAKFCIRLGKKILTQTQKMFIMTYIA